MFLCSMCIKQHFHLILEVKELVVQHRVMRLILTNHVDGHQAVYVLDYQKIVFEFDNPLMRINIYEK